MKINLKADMFEVNKRLAEKFRAGVAQVAEHRIRTPEVGTSSVSTSPNLQKER